MKLLTSTGLPFILLCCLIQCSIHARPVEEPLCLEISVVESGSLLPEYYRPSILVMPDGSLACAWASGSGPLALDNAIYLSYRKSAGEQWTPPVKIADEDGYPDSYPQLALLPDGRMRLFYATLYREKRKAPPGADLSAWHLMYKDSRDGGKSWSGDFFLIGESDLVPASSVTGLRRGELLLPASNLRDKESLFLLSTDGGDYWKDVRITADTRGLVDPVFARLDNGRITALLRPHEHGEREHVIWQAESGDNGETWSGPVQTTLKNPCGRVALLELANGHLLLAFNNHDLWLTPLTVALSTDGGATWDTRRNIVTGQWDNREPSLAQTKDGHIHLVYVARNIYIKHVEFNESWLLEQDENSGRR